LDKTKQNKILEIGSFEGLSSVFFADNFIDNQNSNLTCVDPFLTINNNDHSQFLKNNEEMNFDYNILICKNSHKITVHKITSDIFFKNNKNRHEFSKKFFDSFFSRFMHSEIFCTRKITAHSLSTECRFNSRKF